MQEYEKKYRHGITRVPNVRYENRNKFSFGAVLEINELSYYVAVSSFKTKQEANILITVPEDKERKKGSLRFNFMIPIPRQCLKRLVIKDIENQKYRLLVNKEYVFCMKNKERIMVRPKDI